ncbi:MAG: hypothetical protein HQM04_10670 [Magnetococcales bacterium]|nr:hypothetical protein [Magnetococcales bacterium]MBF0115487.1 hypothetical protein [Magnetococcales bacterium]
MDVGVFTVLAAMVTLLVPLSIVLLIVLSLLPVLVAGKYQADKEGATGSRRVLDWL